MVVVAVIMIRLLRQEDLLINLRKNCIVILIIIKNCKHIPRFQISWIKSQMYCNGL